MNKLRIVVLAGIFFSFFAYSNSTISLSGTVKDGGGTALSGALVVLASDTALKDTTDAKGEFAIGSSTGIAWKSTQGRAARGFNIKGNQLQFATFSAVGFSNVTIFSGSGKQIAQITSKATDEGIQSALLPDLAPGFYVVKISIGKVTETVQLLSTGKELFLSAPENLTGSISTSPIKASAGIIDTLIITKSGYTTAKKQISTYVQSGIAIVLEQGAMYDYAATVENTCSDCVVPELPDAGKLTEKNTKLPDPFKKIDGKRITKKSEWRCRRQEILKQAMKYIYGEKPAPPEVVTGSVTSTKISVHVEDLGKKIDFTATVKLPATGKAPYPAIISVGSFGGVLMGESKILAEGVAIINYDNGKIGAEQQPEGNVDRSKDFTGLFYTIYGGKHDAGLLMAWAWGASRIIDVLQKSGGDIIDYRRLGVTGCSRTAKAAFAIGLFDERMALTLPEETSVVGVPAYRIADAKCPENTDNNFRGQLWLSNNFKPFVKNTSLLPIDAHELVAAFAPRALYSMENPAATQMCAIGGNMSVQGGMDVYKALGAEKNLTYRSDTPAGTGHCSYTSNFTDPLLKNITKFLKHESAETGGIVAGSSGTVPRADWIDWTAPTLEDDTKIYVTR